jgi:phosphatidate cytidylyltransferase
MGELRTLTVTQQVGLLFVVLFGLLTVITLIAFGRSFREIPPEHVAGRERFARELRALWLGALLFWVAWASGPLGSTLLFGLVSFFALREFVTLTHTRRADHRALLLAFFVVLPAQYVLVGMRLINAFTVFIPVYVFFALPVISALANDPFRFLERTAKIQWGVTVCVYGMSHAPALLLLDLPGYHQRGAFLVLFLVLVVVAAQLGQE